MPIVSLTTVEKLIIAYFFYFGHKFKQCDSINMRDILDKFKN